MLQQFLDLMKSTLSNVAGNVGSAAVGLLAGYLISRFREKLRLGHLAIITQGEGRIHISLPRLVISEWVVHGTILKANQPPNVPLMPMAEGGAVARLVLAMQKYSRKCNIEFHVGSNFKHENGSLICIGGPSLNVSSRKFIQTHFPLFELKYPEHEASYDGMKFIPKMDPDGNLLDDFGFIFTIRQKPGKCIIILCGVWGTGTEMAVRGLLKLDEHKDALRMFKHSQKSLVVLKGKIDDFQTRDIKIFQTHELD